MKRERLANAKKVVESQPIPRNVGESDEEYAQRYAREEWAKTIKKNEAEARAASWEAHEARRNSASGRISRGFEFISGLALAVVVIVFVGFAIGNVCDSSYQPRESDGARYRYY